MISSFSIFFFMISYKKIILIQLLKLPALGFHQQSTRITIMGKSDENLYDK